MILDFLLSRIEHSFFEHRKAENLFFEPSRTSFRLAPQDLSYIMDYIMEFEKSIFRNCDVDSFGDKELFLLRHYREAYNSKFEFLSQLFHSYAYGRYDNMFQAAFYRFLVDSLDSFVNKNHLGFMDKEKFLNKRKIVHSKELPKNAVSGSQLQRAPKPLILKSPDKVVLAFEFLAEKGFCKINNVSAFVHDAFAFPSQYVAPKTNGFYHVVWEKPYHSLTVLMRDLKNKGRITNTKQDLIEWVSVLLPSVSKDSIRKYMSSNDKKLSEKKSIDIQIFN